MIQVAVQGVYSFAAGSDDGTRLRIDGTTIIDSPYPRGFGVSYGQIELSAGDHTFEWVSYEQGGAAGFELSVSPVAGNTSEITEANGWKVLGHSNPHAEIQLKPSTSMTATAYYVTGGYKLHASVAGNYIGTDPTGASSIPNALGVYLGNVSTVSIGGAQSSMRNVISGNQTSGISGYFSTDIAIQENLIGLNGSGQESLGNGYGGIDLYQPRDLYVKNNVISSNQLGLQANNPNNAVIIGNIIGLAADGLTPRPNTTLGLGVFQGANVRIGTDGNGQGDASEGNLVSANGWTNIYFSGIDASIAGNIVGTDKNYGQLSNIPVGNGITLQYALDVRMGTDGSQDTYNSAERNVVSGNNGDGISVDNSSTITIAGNLVGVSPEDKSVGNANTGILVNNSQNVVIGTNGDGSMDQIEGNVSSGNNVGIAVFGQQSSGNRVSGNTVGTNMAGTSAFPNLFTGIWLWYSDGTIVGTDGNGVSDDLERNVSSGNVGNGVSLEHASNNRIAGNYLGTSADGLLAIPNSGDGIRLVGRMTGNIIGTDSSNDNFNANERNLISGNNTYGISTQSSANKNIVIAGNWIGLDATGNAPLPNKNQGVWVENSTEVRVGTDGDGNYDALERNVVSGNLSAGIGFYTGNAQVYGIPMVAKLLSGQVPTIQTSGMIAQADLSDASNPENGVWNYNHPVPGGGGDDYAVVVTGTIDVATQGSYSFALSGSDGGRLRIDGQTVILDDAIHGYMSVYGHVELTAGPHSFEWIGFERDAIAGWELSVSNTSNNTSPVSSANGWKVLGDPEPHSEIRLTPNTLMSVTTYKVNGLEAANLSIAGNYVGTNASGDAIVPNTGYGIYGVYSKNFTIGGSNPAMANLVGEIRVDNATDFNVEGNIGGLDKTGAVALGAGEITSYDSSQFQFKSNLIGSGGGIWIHRGSDAEVTGNSVGFASDGVTPRPAGGVNVYDSTRILIGTDGDGQNDAAEGNLVGATDGRSANINLVNSTDIAIAGNVIGANKNYTAIAGLPAGVAGIHISDSSNIRIGTDGSDDSFNASERNVIAGNTSHGIAMGSSSNSTIAGNLIGLTPSSVSLANAADGVFLENTTGVIIGTNADGQRDSIEGNVISGNNGFGVRIQGNGSSGNRVAGNLIGTSINGLAALGNSYSGVEIRDASKNNIIGGSSPVERNTISGNTSDGIRLIDAQTSGNIISGNFIGTTADGLSSLPNAQGISLQSGASNNRIGLSSNYVAPANLLVNGDIEAPAIVGVGQTQVGLGGSKWTTQVSTASDYGGAISGISGWSYAATEGGSTRMHTDIGIARIDSQFRKNSTGQAIYANRWDKLISQTVPNTFTSGTTITAEIDFSTVGSLTDAGRGTYFYLVAGEANPTNLDQLSSRSIVLAQMTAANPTWTSFTPDVVVPINEPRRLTLRYTFQPNDPALNLPLTIAVRLAGGSVGPGYYDNASLTASTANPSVIPEYGNLISGNSQNGILVEGAGSTGNVIAGNWIGTNTNGTAALANGANGIRMLAPSNTIGTDGDGNYDYLERNVVSGNSGVGIVLSGTNVTSGVIAGNIIGLTSNATAVLGNQAQGILIESGATSTRIGTNGDGYSDVAERNYISGNVAGGIWIKDSGTQSHVIAGNYIGTDQWGQLDRGNTGFGVQVSLGVTNTIIGTNGTNDAYNANESNVISGNSTSGVVITGVATNSNAIAGNYIGLRAGGRLALANDLSGIMVSSGAMFNRIGTDGNGIYDTLERNVISGNNSSGVEINGVGTSENNVAGNFIGTDSTGLLDRGNNAHGVHITDSQGVSVSGNIISGNNGHGVLSQDDSGTILQSNYVGLDVTGNNPLGNSSRGIFLERTSNATVGGNATGSGNTIAANLGVGLFVDGGSNNWIAGNLIGTNASGNSARPNLVGIQLSNGASYNRIGSNGDGTLDLNERNIISGNRENGVVITGGTSVGNSIAGNRIGTDISGTNALANELSGIYNAGSLTQIGSNRHDYDYSGTALRNLVSGNLQSGIVSVGNASSYDETYSVWIAHNDFGLNASGNGLLPNGQNGVRIIDGSIAQVRSNVISGNNSAGLFGANLTTRIMATGNRIGTDSNGMIDYGNNSAGVRIENVPYARLDSNIISGNSGSGVEIIGASHQSWLSGNRIGVNATGTEALPNDQNGVLLSGTEYTQIGAFNQQDAIYWGNTISGNKGSGIQAIDLGMAPFIGWNAVGTNASGTQAISNQKFGILAQNAPINAFSNTVSGNISGGVAIVGSNSRDSSLRANTIGLNALGNAAIANGQFGVYVGSGQLIGLAGISDAWRNRIGGSTSGDRNIISGNNGPGVWIAGTSSKESVVEGNYLGTDRLGQLAIPNSVGVLITDGANLNIIGGPLTSSRNLISGNATSGVILRGAFTVNNIIRGNWIGTDSTGSVAIANQHYGIQIAEGAAYASILSNVISGNALGGVLIQSGGSNTLRGNWIGTDSTGTLALGNGRSGSPRFGVKISAGNANLVGGIESLDRNVISGNFGDGLVLADGTFGNSVQGNAVGTNFSGEIVISNTANGILLDGDSVVNNTIGGAVVAAGNLIYNNLAAGLRLPGLTASTASQNLFDQNIYQGNLGLAIDIGQEGANTNDANDTDSLPNAPGIVAAFLSTVGSVNSLVVQGYTRPGRTVQFYVSAPTASGRGQGTKRIASLTEGSADDTENRTGNFPGLNDLGLGSDENAAYYEFTIPLASPAPIEFGDLISAIGVGSTSEFGNIRVVGDVASNQPPQITLPSDSVTIAAGDTLQLSGSFIDTDSTRWTATVDYGDGSAPEVLALSEQQTFTLSHRYDRATDGSVPYHVTLAIVDNGGKQSTSVINVQVNNVSPTISASNIAFASSVNEGSQFTVTGTFSDTSPTESHTVSIQWGDGTSSTQTIEAGVYTFALSHTYADDNPTNTASDPAALRITVSDSYNASATAEGTFVTTVMNVQPTNLILSTNLANDPLSGKPVVFEGNELTLSGNWNDPGLGDSHRVVIDWGDGSSPITIEKPNEAGQTANRSFSVSHTYTNNPFGPASTYSISVSVADDDEPLVSNFAGLEIQVQDVAPNLTTLSWNQGTIQENSVAVLNIAFTDPGVLDTHRLRIDWGDGTLATPNIEEVIPSLGGRTVQIPHRYLNNRANDEPYSVSVEIVEIDPVSGNIIMSGNTLSTSLVVTNVAPVLTTVPKLFAKDANGVWNELATGDTILEGTQVKLTGTYSDVGTLDTHSVRILWSSSENLSSDASVNSKDGTFEAYFTYADDYTQGTSIDLQNLLVSLFDNDGAIAMSSNSLLVQNVDPDATFIPNSNSTTTTISLQSRVVDPGVEVFSYYWHAIRVASSDVEGGLIPGVYDGSGGITGTTPDFTFDLADPALGPTNLSVLQITLIVSDDDLGSDTYVSSLFVGSNGDDTIDLQTRDFASGVSNLTVLSFDGSDVINASGLPSGYNVILDGGTGQDRLIGGPGNDTFILRDGNDIANQDANGNSNTDYEQGDDTYLLSPNSTLTVIDRSGGNNTLDFSRANIGTTNDPKGVTFDLSQLTSTSLTTFDVGELTGETNRHFVRAQGNFNTLVGSSYGDDITGRTGSNVFTGAGADAIKVAVGTTGATFNAGADADVFTIGDGSFGEINFEGDSGADVFNIIGASTFDQINFSGDSGADVFNLGGGFEGEITFGGGADADVFTFGEGIGAGTIIFSGGADADVFTIGTGSADLIDFRGDSGADVFDLGGVLSGDIIFSGGADADVFTIGSGGTADGIDFNGDSGADVFTLGGDAGTIIFSGGADADVFTIGLGGSADGIDFNGDSGADVFTLGGDAGTIIFTGGADADVFAITSTGSADDINFAGDSGADVFQLGGTVGGDIIFTGGADADVFVITETGAGDAIDFRGDAGDDTLSVLGAVNSMSFTGGEGSDRFRNNRSNLSSLVFYGFENPSNPRGGSELNDGDDVLYNYGSNIGSVAVLGGQGKDVFYSLGNLIDTVSFEGGADADVFILTGTDIDTINFGGGADADVFDLSGVDIGSIDFRGDSSDEGAGNDVFINRSSGKSDSNGLWISTISFTAGGGMDTFRNDSSEWKEIFFQGGDGADRFQNNAQGIETIVFDAGQADDYFENNADNLSGIVFLGGSGNDVYVNRGENVSDLIFFGDAGDDQFFNYGADAQGIWFLEQSGTNRLVNRADRTHGVVFQGGAQSDTLINSGAAVSGIKLIGNAGEDRFLNDTTGVGASDLWVESTGAIPDPGHPDSFTWPTIVSPLIALPSIPSPTVDDGADWVFNRAASVQSLVFHGDTGDDYFQNSGGGLTDSEFHGGSGNDTVLNTSGGTTLSSFVFYGSTGNDAMQNDAANAQDLMFFGNEGNDSLYQNGIDFEAITFDAGDGTDILVNWGAGGSVLRMIAGSGDDRFQNNANRVGLVYFDAGLGGDALQNNGDEIQRIEMLGDAGNDALLNSGNLVSYILFNGGVGDDSLVNSGSGIGGSALSGTPETGIRFDAGDGANVLRTQGVNLSTLVFQGGLNSDSLVYNTTAGGSIDYSGLGGQDGFVFRGSADHISVDLGDGQDSLVFSGTVESSVAATPTVLIDGGAGDDTYQFLGTPLGYLQLTELYSGVADTSRDMLDFSAYLGGLISIDLASATKQSLGSGFWLQLPVDSLMGIEDVRGSQAGDTILGNDRPNVLMGARYLSSTPGDALARNRESQWVLLDFDTKTDSQEYVYTDSDRESVIEGLRRIYYGYNPDGTIRQYSDPGRWFNVRFTTDIGQIPKDASNNAVDHVVIRFNNTPPEGTPGGSSSEIDVGNTGFSGEAWVQVHGLLGGTALAPQLSVSGNEISGDFMSPPSDGALTYGQRNPDNTVPNFLALSVKIAAHELAHLMGLRHYDAFGPIGSGVHTPPGNSAFNPAYPGVSEAFETFSHLISSPASVGSDRKNDIGNLFFGEREAIKLSYVMSDPASTRSSESLTPVDRQNGLSQNLSWKTLTVPNTIQSGQNSNANLYAEILSVTGQIQLDPVTGSSEDDRYSFTGRSGDIVTIEVSSRALKRFSNMGSNASLTPDGYIDSRLSLLGSNGELVGYYDSVAFNDDEFESSDSILIDVVLPSDGNYTIVVDSFTRGVQPSDPDPTTLSEIGRKLYNDIINDTDVGNYELFVYRFARENARDVRNTLVGRGGADTYIGTADENYAMSFPSGAIPNAASTTESAGLTVTIPFNDTVGTEWTAMMDYNNDGVVDETLTNFTPGTGLVISHVYSDNGTNSLSFVISNEDGSTLSGQFPVTISNSQPTSTFNTQDAVEGSTAKLIAIGADSTGDVAAGLRYYIGTSFLLRNAATYATSSPSNTYHESFSDSITRELYVRVMDKDGAYTDYTTTLVVENVAPTATISNSGPVAEGTPVLVELSSVIDPSSVDTVAGFRYSFARSMSQLAISGADNSTTAIPSKSFVFDEDSQSPNAPCIVYARVFDKDNGYSTYQTTISVTNANPTASIVSITTPAIVDQSVMVSVDGSDPAGANDPLTYLIEVLRDGSVVASSNSASKALGFTPTQIGAYTARVTAYDDDGGVSAVDTQNFQVRDPLTLVVNGPADGYVGVAGQLRDFSLLATSPGSSGLFNYSIDWKDGSGIEPLSGVGSSYTVTHRYLTVGNFAPVFTVTDSLGRTTSITLTSFTIGLVENQGSFVAIAGTDSGSQSDTVSIEALNSTGQFRATINTGTPFDFSATGVIRIFSDGNSDQLNVFGTAAADLFVVDANSIALNTTWSVQMPSASSRRLSGLDGNDNFRVDQSVAINLEGGNGSDTIESTGGISTNTWTINGLNSGSLRVGTETIDRIVFASTESLLGRDGQTDVYLISGGSLSGSINARGTSDQDQLRYTSGAGFVNLANRQTSSVLGGFLGIESFTSNAGRFDGPGLDTQWTLSGNQSGSLSYLESGVSRTIVFSGFGTLYGGAMSDRFVVSSSGQSLGIFGGGGIDTLVGPSNGATWDLSGADAGNLMGTNPFSQFENLQGSDGVDRFVVRQAANVSGRIDAGLGANILDYSLSTSAVVVDLRTEIGSATRIGSVLDRFTAVVGGTAADTLRASNTRGMLVMGTGGNDLLYGGNQRDVLVGGLGLDRLEGGSGEDIVIGGRTTFDTNLTAMVGVLSEWTRTGSGTSLEERYNNLSNVNPSASRLNGTFFLRGLEFTTGRTLNDDNAVDRLFGQADTDWFIGGTVANDFATTDYTADQKKSTAFVNVI
ncbi:MAG: beta strand repeat-containing protein [Planctomycetota bacterium]